MTGFPRITIFAASCGAIAVSCTSPAAPLKQLGDTTVATAQLEVARQIRREAALIVAVAPQSVIAEEPHAPAFRKQNYTVTGRVVRCFKGRQRQTDISYIITSEGRPAALEKPHIAFLRRMGGQWAAMDGPMFRDSAQMRAGLTKMTPGCGR
ncbi:hypothetical protein [Sphingomonas sp. PB4P5]|uniref:hypothetical protein n=1 Tax=Parasphingomonas puruogangriensis TaxID=3096155 RepID=UPI002FC8D7E7